MGQLYHTTELVGVKYKNISLDKVFQPKTHIEVWVRLDYSPKLCQLCHEKQIKYDFQKASKMASLKINNIPSFIRLKKRRFQCKSCCKATAAETNLYGKIVKFLSLLE